MAKSEVVDRAGNRWVVSRRWTPRWTRVDAGKRFRQFHRRGLGRSRPKERRSRWWDGIDIPDLDVLVVVLAVIAILLLLWFAVFPLLLIVIDAILVGVLFVVGLLARVFLRRPWNIVATRADGVEIQREVVGWRDSRDEIATLRQQIAQGSIALPSPFEPPTPPAPWTSPDGP